LIIAEPAAEHLSGLYAIDSERYQQPAALQNLVTQEGYAVHRLF